MAEHLGMARERQGEKGSGRLIMHNDISLQTPSIIPSQHCIPALAHSDCRGCRGYWMAQYPRMAWLGLSDEGSGCLTCIMIIHAGTTLQTSIMPFIVSP